MRGMLSDQLITRCYSVNRICCICNERITQQPDGRGVSADTKIQAESLGELVFPASTSAYESWLVETGRLNQTAVAPKRPTRVHPAALPRSAQTFTTRTDIEQLQGKLNRNTFAQLHSFQYNRATATGCFSMRRLVVTCNDCNSMRPAGLSAETPSAPKLCRRSQVAQLPGGLLLMCMI